MAKVLCVHDHPRMSVGLKMSLEAFGHQVQSAQTQEDALTILDYNTFDVVLCAGSFAALALNLVRRAGPHKVAIIAYQWEDAFQGIDYFMPAKISAHQIDQAVKSLVSREGDHEI